MDDNPGYKVCTSTTRPSWGAAQKGMLISETDTGLIWRFDGAAFQRVSGSGLLKCSDGTWAQGTRSTNISTTDQNIGVVVCQVNNVVVPPGNRTLMISVTTGEPVNNTRRFIGHIARSNIAGQGPMIMSGWLDGVYGGGNPGQSGPESTWTAYEKGGLAPGTYNYSFQIQCDPNANPAGTSNIYCVAYPVVISVIEL